MINVVWKVDSIEVKPTVDGFQNVIDRVFWSVYAEEDGIKGSTIKGNITLTFLPELVETFIPYENITESKVLEWVKTTMGPVLANSIETDSKKELDNIKNPPTVLPLPWNAQ